MSIVLKIYAREKEGGSGSKERTLVFNFRRITPWRFRRRSFDPGAGANVRVDVYGPH